MATMDERREEYRRNMKKRRRPTILDRALLAATVSVLLAGSACAFLGMYALARAVF